MRSVPEQIIAEVFSLLGDNIKTAIGRRATEDFGRAKRVVAVPVGAPTIDPPDRIGDPLFTNAGRALLLRRFQIEWWCHDVPDEGDGGTFGRAEELYLATLRAVRQTTHNSVRFGNERWMDQAEGQDDFIRHGSVIVFDSVIDLPVYELRGTLVTLTANPKIATRRYLNNEEETT